MNPAPHRPATRFARWLLVTLVGGLLGVAIWWLASRPPPVAPVALRSLVRTNLVRRDGMWFEMGHTNPFAGWLLDYYPSGAPLSRSLVSNGLLNGLSEGWYTNGQLQIQETYRDNRSEGRRTKWYPNGAKLSEAEVAQGQFEGRFRRWRENGSLAEEIPMSHGVPEGLGRSYYESGRVKSEVRLQAGKVVERKEFPDAAPGGSASANADRSPAGTGS